jgi:hypothetical protein
MVTHIGFEPRKNKSHRLPNLVSLEEGDHYSDSSEMLVVDTRGQLCPAEQVERKLESLLGDTSVPLSQLRMRALCARR